MVCQKCGRVIPDGAQCPCSGGMIYSSNPAVNIMKSIGASKLFLTMAILQVITIVLNVAGTYLFDNKANEILESMQPYMNMYGEEFNSIFWNYYNNSVNSSVIIGSIPAIIIAASLFMIYFAAKNTNDGGMKTSGITINKVFQIIGIVIFILAAVVLLLAVIALIAAGGSMISYYGSGYEGIGAGVGLGLIIGILIIGLAVMLLFVFYSFGIVRALNRIKTTAMTGVPDNRISSFVIGFTYVISICTGLSAITSLFSTPVLGLSTLASAVATFIAAKCMSDYKKQMTALMYQIPVPAEQGYSQNGQQPYQQGVPQNDDQQSHTQNAQQGVTDNEQRTASPESALTEETQSGDEKQDPLN